MIGIPKPTRRGPKPRSVIKRYKRPAFARVRGGRGKLRLLADDLQSLYVRMAANWTCWVCDSKRWELMQAAHLFAKSEYNAGRYSLDNVKCLCSPCHKHYTHRPDGWQKFLDARLGMAGVDELRARCQVRQGPHDYVLVAMHYRSLIERHEAHANVREMFDKLQKRGKDLGVW